jgi:hypothetical protein
VRVRFLTLLVATAVALLAQPDFPSGLTAEIERTRASTAEMPAGDRTGPAQRVERARTALAAGRPLLAVYLLEAPWEQARASAFAKDASAVTTAEAFTRAWKAAGEPRATPAPPGRRPVLADALAAAAEARGPSTYRASLPYAQDSGVAAGLYYLGESQAVMRFAAMVRTLPWPATTAAPPLRSIAGELAALDADMTRAYETMDRSHHPTYISASAALKQARTLDAAGQYAGALLQYLLSRYLFAPLRGPAAGEATPALIAAARASLDAATDHSILELFLQLADEGLAGDVAAQRRGAAAVLEDLVPAYRAALAPATTAPVAAAAAARTVTITLVRWPFT